MVVALKIEIENPDLIASYGKLVKAYGEKNSVAQTNITIDMEKIIAKTVFRGTTIQSGAGQGNPDFLVTNDGLNALLQKISSTQDDIDNFNKFVSQAYGAGTPIEAKIMRNDSDRDIKIGTFTPSLTSDKIRYFDFLSGDIIDTTRFSIVQSLRESYQTDPAAQAPSSKELKTNIKRSDLQSFIKTTSPEFQKLVMSDPNVRALDKILSANAQQKQSSTQISALVEKINQKWAKSSLEAELTRLSQKGTLFDYIASTPALKSQFYTKSRTLSIFRYDNSKVNSLVMFFPMSDFTNKFFGAKYDEGKIKVYIKSEIEKEFLNQLGTETASLKLGQSMENYDASVKQLAATGSLKDVSIPGLDLTIKYLVPTGGSIPMSSGNFFNVNRIYKRTPFVKTGTETIGKYAGISAAPQGTFLSSEYLSLLVIQKVVREMPHGPIGGKPLSSDVLTYRTGRFANSIQLMVDYRQRVVRYYYNPIYYIHEVTTRDPRKLIESSIRSVMQEKFRQQFNISEVYGAL